MSNFKKLSHTIYECKYHIVFCPKYRYQIFEGQIGEYTKQQVYSLANINGVASSLLTDQANRFSEEVE